jgi:hypothetical protein
MRRPGQTGTVWIKSDTFLEELIVGLAMDIDMVELWRKSRWTQAEIARIKWEGRVERTHDKIKREIARLLEFANKKPESAAAQEVAGLVNRVLGEVQALLQGAGLEG